MWRSAKDGILPLTRVVHEAVAFEPSYTYFYHDKVHVSIAQDWLGRRVTGRSLLPNRLINLGVQQATYVCENRDGGCMNEGFTMVF